jgi:metal-dependent amidase/aminoacylase/carboxypeptidase family protein
MRCADLQNTIPFVHPIITQEGVANVIPADVRLETYVRGRTVEAIPQANTKVDRALQAAHWRLAPKSRSRPPAIATFQ